MFWKRTDSHKPPLFNFCDRIPITRGSITFTLKILQPFYHNVSFVFAKAKFIFIFGGSLRTRSYFYFLIKAAPRQTLLLEKNFSDSEWYFSRSFRQINLPCFAIVNSRNALPRVLYILISTDLSALLLFPAKFFLFELFLHCYGSDEALDKSCWLNILRPWHGFRWLRQKEAQTSDKSRLPGPGKNSLEWEVFVLQSGQV